MIYLCLSGRFGNQLFQYAYALSLLKEFYPAETITVCTTAINKRGFEYQLDQIGISNVVIQEEFPVPTYGLIVRALIKPARDISYKINNREMRKRVLNVLWGIKNKFGIYCGYESYYYLKSRKAFTKNKYIYGFFESEDYCKKVLDGLYDSLWSQSSGHESVIQKINNIRNCESICVSVRRGDFLNEGIAQTHNVCTKEYYKAGVEMIRKMHPESKVYVFSDDISWCRNNLDFGENVEYESEGNTILEKIQLMSSCKHFVIANSTFSWWAQMLSSFKNKTVIAPHPWKNNEDHEDVYCSYFTIIEVDKAGD